MVEGSLRKFEITESSDSIIAYFLPRFTLNQNLLKVEFNNFSYGPFLTFLLTTQKNRVTYLYSLFFCKEYNFNQITLTIPSIHLK